MSQLTVVTDFDGTLMEQDVGDLLMKTAGVVNEAAAKEAYRSFEAGEIGSMEVARTSYSFLANRKSVVDEVIRQVSPREGAVEFLEFCHRNGVPVTVLSDGMEYYIKQIIHQMNLKVDQVISNPIYYTEEGGYRLGFQNPNEACQWCGCCKAEVVRNIKRQGSRVLYIGDGTSDYYGSGFADWIFARARLARYLDEAEEVYFPFTTFHDVLNVLEPNLDQFRSGEALGKRKVPNTFCRFND
ncbi:MtnX-like HAD-IB family phosphatase [Paenibacillus sp. J2TS4]|uniref:MtnX-like HAD-IB family phosphatase n=1 Tax=Paenibacillus sp. J2TS4 TaxID=2807194 RepID=UPI001B1616EA|nr:MtnX-like HAD-IB family phosphatase [Paenibacillus sp. J2TS4]GIP31089.1 2,3-diketo-5-methylthio-1-phosphopentane phosphatase [Paenibacillus sp. J2TS4]